MSKVFISGPCSGYAHANRPAFERVTELLRKDGHIVLSPAHFPIGLEHHEYMSMCYPMIDIADTVYFLYGWQYSKGCRLEFDHAIRQGKRLEFEESIENPEMFCSNK